MFLSFFFTVIFFLAFFAFLLESACLTFYFLRSVILQWNVLVLVANRSPGSLNRSSNLKKTEEKKNKVQENFFLSFFFLSFSFLWLLLFFESSLSSSVFARFFLLLLPSFPFTFLLIGNAGVTGERRSKWEWIPENHFFLLSFLF